MLSPEEQTILIDKIVETLGVGKKIAKAAVSSVQTEEEAFEKASIMQSQERVVNGLLEDFELPRKRARLARKIASRTEYDAPNSAWLMRRVLTGERYSVKKAKGVAAESPQETLTEIESEIAKIAEDLRPCYQCAQCSSGCPVFLVDPSSNPRVFVEELLLNPSTEIFGSDRIWQCSYCLNCSHVCPHGVDLGHIFMKIRNLAVKLGYKAPEAFVKEAEIVYGSGITAKPSKAILKRREKLGLPQLLPTDTDEIQKLLGRTGFKARIDAQKATKDSQEDVIAE
ncbi:MAG: 4Fe-4S dicluster domain-containing protein [Candidatus Thorarchaeota archaeon]